AGSGVLTVTLSGSGAFAKTADGCTGLRLAMGSSCDVTVEFSPSAAGASSARLGATSPKASAGLRLTGAGVVSGHVYWANFSAGSIGRADLDGSNPNQSFITGASNPVGVAV